MQTVSPFLHASLSQFCWFGSSKGTHSSCTPVRLVVFRTCTDTGSPYLACRIYSLPLLSGTRMWRRGADTLGNVANFVESEQLLETEGYMASFVQVPHVSLTELL